MAGERAPDANSCQGMANGDEMHGNSEHADKRLEPD